MKDPVLEGRAIVSDDDGTGFIAGSSDTAELRSHVPVHKLSSKEDRVFQILSGGERSPVDQRKGPAGRKTSSAIMK